MKIDGEGGFFPAGEWRHVELIYDREARRGTGTIAASIDSAEPTELPAPPVDDENPFAIFVGGCGAQGSAPAR